MAVSPTDEKVMALLKKLAERRRKRFLEGKGVAFQIDPAPGLIPGWKIPTLTKGIYHDPSPMLRCRFAFAGTWVHSEPGKTWLNLKQLEDVWNDSRVQAQIKVRYDNWEDSILQIVPWDRLSLLGIDLPEYNESYLHWLEDEIEPRVIHYFGHSERIFKDFYELLVYLTT